MAVKASLGWVDPWIEPTTLAVRNELRRFFENDLPLPCALVLAWDGEPHRQGCWHVVDALERLECDEVPSHSLLLRVVRQALQGDARMLRKRVGDVGTFVFLDAHRKEVIL